MATRVERVGYPLIVIVGPTASGKTTVAVELAEQLGGEIICADSRTIYKDMDIGTAKPSSEERQRVVHWGIDLVSPDQEFTVSDFKQYADEKIADIRSRGKVPILVGGTGLYTDAVIFDYQFGGKADVLKREYLESLRLEELHVYCYKNNIELPENRRNKRYVIRTIERSRRTGRRQQEPIDGSIIVGIATEKDELRTRIADRAEQLFAQPVVEEAKMLGKKYGWESEAMTGNIYPLLRSHLCGEMSLEEVKSRFKDLDWKLAKRQLTWFRRNPHIEWLTRGDVTTYVNEVFAAK